MRLRCTSTQMRVPISQSYNRRKDLQYWTMPVHAMILRKDMAITSFKSAPPIRKAGSMLSFSLLQFSHFDCFSIVTVFLNSPQVSHIVAADLVTQSLLNMVGLFNCASDASNFVIFSTSSVVNAIHECFFAESSLSSDITATQPNKHPANRDHYLPSPAPCPRQTA